MATISIAIIVCSTIITLISAIVIPMKIMTRTSRSTAAHEMFLARQFLNKNKDDFPVWYVDFQNMLHESSVEELIAQRTVILISLSCSADKVNMSPDKSCIELAVADGDSIMADVISLAMTTEFIDHHKRNTAPTYTAGSFI